MKPSIWLRKHPLPRLRSTIKHLISWTDAEVVALAVKINGQYDLNNKQIQLLIKSLRDEHVIKPPSIESDWDTEIVLKPNKLKLGPVTETYKSGKYTKTRYGSLQEAVGFALDLIQNSKVCWEETYKPYLESTKSKISKNMQIPLPDNAEDSKKYWGLQAGDSLVSDDTEYVITQVKPTLDGPPVIIYEKTNEKH